MLELRSCLKPSNQLRMNIPDADMLIATSLTRRFSYLIELIAVHERTNSLAEMKSCIDDAFKMAEHEMFNTPYDRIRLLLLQARHSYLTGDNDSAVEHAEEALGLCRAKKVGASLQVVLVACANYNLHCDNMEVGVEQLSEAVQILTHIFGRSETTVISLNSHLKKIRAGEQKTLPDRMLFN
jgi:hypothetical protein